MNASFYMPTRVFFGEGALINNKKALAIGKHAFIVTGARSAKASGALDDVTTALNELGISYTVFDKIRENPPLLTCFEGGKMAAEIMLGQADITEMAIRYDAAPVKKYNAEICAELGIDTAALDADGFIAR